MDPDQFAQTMEKIVHMGACVMGGCCGTTPGHICAMIERTKGLSVIPPSHKDLTISYPLMGRRSCWERSQSSSESGSILTGKKKFKQALKDHDLDYILKEGIMQQDKGAHILDVNVGLPDIDESAMMQEVVTQLQSVTSLPAPD